MNFATVAFIAIDEHGLGNAMMVEIIGDDLQSDWDGTEMDCKHMCLVVLTHLVLMEP